MVSFSGQTSPLVSHDSRRVQRLELGSLDSFSSDLATTTGVGGGASGVDSSTLKSFDIDSLCSSAYYDMAFAGYTNDSMPVGLASSGAVSRVHSHQNTPPTLASTPTTPLRRLVGSGAGGSLRGMSTRVPPTIRLDRSSDSPFGDLSIHHRRHATSSPHRGSLPEERHITRQVVAAPSPSGQQHTCLPIPTMPSEQPNRLPLLLNARMPLQRCPSCSNVTTDSPIEAATVQRVHAACGIMPSDFLSQVCARLRVFKYAILSALTLADHSRVAACRFFALRLRESRCRRAVARPARFAAAVAAQIAATHISLASTSPFTSTRALRAARWSWRRLAAACCRRAERNASIALKQQWHALI